MREALSETLPVRIATGEIRAYLPVSSDEGMAAGSGTSLSYTQDVKTCHRPCPEGTRRNNTIITSKRRRFDVVMTLLLRHRRRFDVIMTLLLCRR